MKFLPRVCDSSLFFRFPCTQFPMSMIHSDLSGIRPDLTIKHYEWRSYHYIFRHCRKYIYNACLNVAFKTRTWYYLYNSNLCIGHYRDSQTAQGTVVQIETVMMSEPQARALSVLNSILLYQEESINHDNPLCISNYSFYFNGGNKTF